MEHVLHFQTHGFKTRQNYSSLQSDGLGDSWGELAVPHLLAKFVFTELKNPGWVGLKADELADKCKPYALEARAHWKRLKVSHVRGGVDNGRTLSKDKWCDGLLFAAQDECMRERLRLNRAVTRLAILALCARRAVGAGLLGETGLAAPGRPAAAVGGTAGQSDLLVEPQPPGTLPQTPAGAWLARRAPPEKSAWAEP